LLDALENEQAERVSAKLVSVCQQFLNWPVEAEQPVDASQPVAEHLVMRARPTRDKGQLAAAPQWEIVADLIARSKRTVAATAVEPMLFEEPAQHEQNAAEHAAEASDAADTATGVVAVAAAAAAAEALKIPDDFEPVMRSIPMPQQQPSQSQPQPTLSISQTSANDDVTEVIDLPAHAVDGGVAGIIDAILRHCASELVECPIAPPMCPKARLAVGRDRRVVMLAVARHGLADLNTIGLAYKWLQENQTLIGMAVPQLSIDTHQAPHLSLLIDQADSAAHTLQPMLQGDHVTVKTYRKLRWGGRMGLLLEAA
jgi:hypothetical protein